MKVPEGRNIRKLEELASIERGKFSVRPRNDPRYFGGSMPFVQTGDITSSNMNSAGSSETNAAKFGDPPYEDNKGLILRNYTFTEFPNIEPDGFCYLHFHVDLLDNSKQYQTTIRFVLDPREMEIVFDTVRGPYIWRMTNNKWTLKRPLQVHTGSAWSDVENQGDGDN